MRHWKQTTLVILGWWMMTAAAAVASPGHGGGKGGMFKKIIQELNLTEDQKKQVGEIRKKHQAQMKELRGSGKTIRQELFAAMQSPKKGPEYRAELKGKFEKAQELRQKVAAARFEMALDIREILTPEQLAKFKGLGGGMGHGHGHGHGHGRPDSDHEPENDD